MRVCHTIGLLAPFFRLFLRFAFICTTTAAVLAGSAAACASSAFAQCVRFFFLDRFGVRCHFGSEVSCGSSVASASLASHRGHRSVEASLVELSVKSHVSVAMSWFCVSSKHKSTTRFYDGSQLRHRRRRCSDASLVELAHKTRFSSSLCVKPETPRKVVAQCVRFFFLDRFGVRCHFGSEVSCGSSVASASLASHRGHRSVEASLVELSVKTHVLSRDELVLCQFEAQVYDEILRREPASTSSAALLRCEPC